MNFSKKKISGIFIIVLSCAFMLTSSLAWQDVTQHKTNNFNTVGTEYTVVLIENFAPIEKWSQGATESKKVSVRNGSDLDPTNLDYGEAYVRIQFKQYLEIQEIEYVNSIDRYMVDTNGNFLRGDVDEVKAQLTAMGLKASEYEDDIVPAYSVYDDVDKEDDTSYKHYVKTKENDPNGVFGKHLVVGVNNVGTPTSLISGVSRSDDAGENHNSASNNDDSYTTKTWDGSDTDKAFEQYIDFVLGDTIRITEWIESGAEPVDKWIIDDISGDGWVYWGQALQHSHVAKQPLTQTTDFLTGVTLKEHPGGGNVFYQVHVNLDASSQKSMGEANSDGEVVWGDAPVAILSAFKAENVINYYDMLVQSISEAEVLVANDASLSALSTVLTSAKSTIGDSSITKDIGYKASFEALESAMQDVYKTKLQSLIADLLPEVEEQIQQIVDRVEQLILSQASLTELKQALTELEAAIATIV